MPFCLRQFFNAPAFSLKLIDSLNVFGDHPVGANNAIETIFSPKQVGDQVFVVTVANIIVVHSILVEGNGVIRHYRSRHPGGAFQFEGPFCKWFEMIFQVLTRIDCIGPITKMAIPTALFRATARPVFHHGIHTLVSPASTNFVDTRGGLEAVDISPCHIGREGRTFTHGPVEPVPTWFCSKINLG